MSIRIHVCGAFGATDSEFRKSLDSIGNDGQGSSLFRIGSSGQWKWAHASVWNVDGDKIDAALSSLSVPSLRVTSSDSVLWMLTVTQAGRDTFRGVHFFTQIGQTPQDHSPQQESEDNDFPDDEPDEIAGISRFIPELQFLWDADEEARVKAEVSQVEAIVPALSEYAWYGVELPATVIEAIKQEPTQAWHTAFMAHGLQIVTALSDFGFEFDHDVLVDLLTIGPLNDIEKNSDIGNLPRFLQALGIEGVFGTVNEDVLNIVIEEKRCQDAPLHWSNHPPGPFFQKIESLIAECPMTEIGGGTVRVSHAARLHLLTHLMAENPITSVLIAYPDTDTRPTGFWNNLSALEVRETERHWQFCFEASHWWHRVAEEKELESNALTLSIGNPPDGTRVELTFITEGLSERCHRYAGRFHKQQLEIDQTYPQLTAVTLNDALSLIKQTFGMEPILLTSEQEVKAVRHNYLRSQGEPPRIRNGKIKPECGSRGNVIQTLLFERFNDNGAWDISGARERNEDDWKAFEETFLTDDEDLVYEKDCCEASAAISDFEQKIFDAVATLNETKSVPHSNEVLFDGRTGKFFKASMSQLPHISKDSLDEHDAAMAAIGFQSIADAVGDVDHRQEITRCYAGHHLSVSLLSHRNANNQFDWAATSYGAISVDFSKGTTEFHTHFENGMTLATTSLDAARSKPDVGIYIRSYEDLPIAELWEKHLDGVHRFVNHFQTTPFDHTDFGNPVRFLTFLDSLLCRVMGKE